MFSGDLELRFAGREGYLQNSAYSTVPLVIRANRDTQTILNSFANYLANGWNPDDGCRLASDTENFYLLYNPIVYINLCGNIIEYVNLTIQFLLCVCQGMLGKHDGHRLS